MFTGIVEELGSVVARDGSRLRIAASAVLEGAGIGDSTAVNGCCLTVVGLDRAEGWWDADVSDETYARTNLGDLGPGDPVNLERPVRLEDRLGGHLVQGHVDAVGEIVVARARPAGPHAGRPAPLRGREGLDHRRRDLASPSSSRSSTASPSPSSRTPRRSPRSGAKGPGATVNLEVDVIAKYAERLLEGQLGALAADGTPTTATTTAPSEEAR